uniref:NACHT domain-containing protein n=1 Tax=Streptomyces chartreusis TaxID=1969 RepID=UPI003F49B32E
MDETSKTLARRVLSISGWTVIDEPTWPGPEESFAAHRSHWGSAWRASVVCPGPAGPGLSGFLDTVERHFAAYLDDGHFREVLVVLDGKEPGAELPGHRDPRIVVRTIDQLLRSSIDFKPHLEDLARNFEEFSDGLSRYYVKPRARNFVKRREQTSHEQTGEDIEEMLVQWIEAPVGARPSPLLDPGRPVAILGAYGIGKSSLATSMAAQLARAALTEQDRRIPVLIRLGEVSGEQTLEGLLGKHFTARYATTGYSFGAFEELNRRGQLVVILDGFDEMKQMLSWREFIYNLKQLNRLQVGQTRMIILGRPTVFESDSEHQRALHGQYHRGTSVFREAGLPDYQEVEIAPLEPEQITKFLEDYLEYRGGSISGDRRRIRQLSEQILSPQLGDIARRPVQLRMLADILPDYHGSIDDLHLGRVYDSFIDDLIERVILREEEKHSRIAFDHVERREFLKQFAFWLWNARSGSVVTTDMIPDHLIEPFVGNRDIDSVRRDLVAGAPLDRRYGERVRFPHRSFQEFLVADSLWERLQSRELSLADADPMINPEVADFMVLQRGRTQEGLAQRLLLSLDSPVSRRTWNALLLNDSIVEDVYQRMTTKGQAQLVTDAELLMLALWTLSNPSSESLLKLEHLLQGRGPSLLYRFFCSLAIGAEARRNDVLIELLGRLAAETAPLERITAQRVQTGAVVALDDSWVARPDGRETMVGKVAGKARIKIHRQGRQEIAGGENLAVTWLTHRAVLIHQKIRIVRGGGTVDVRNLRPLLVEELSRGPFVSEWIWNDALDPSIMPRDEFDLPTGAALRAGIAEFESVTELVGKLVQSGLLPSTTISGALRATHEAGKDS